MKTTKPRQRGFSLLETVISLTITLGLTGMALPTLSNLVKSASLETSADLLLSHLHLARGHAISHNSRVMVCPNQNGKCGKNQHWNQGWLVFEDLDEDRKLDKNEAILARRNLNGSETKDSISIAFRKRPAYAYFKPDGRAWPNGSFRFCSPDSGIDDVAIIITMSGRARLAPAEEANERCS